MLVGACATFSASHRLRARASAGRISILVQGVTDGRWVASKLDCRCQPDLVGSRQVEPVLKMQREPTVETSITRERSTHKGCPAS